MFVAEAPGTVEDREGTPLHRLAKTGMEFNMLLRRRSISRERSYVTNLVKCHPPRDEDPSPECILACSTYLEREILRVNPRMIVAVGRHAARYLLNRDTDMEMVHGIPFMTNLPYLPTQIPVLPVYHPAAGLHDPNRMLQVQQDFDCIKPVLTGELAPRTAYYSDPFVTQEQYLDDGTWEIQTQKGESPIVAIDTEWVQGGPWCLTVSSKPGTAYLLYAYMKSEIADLDEVLKSTNSLVLLHNAPYDLPVLHKLGLYPARFLDTMNMAYLLQSEPQGLKALAFRIAGMRMENYLDMVAPATHRNAMLYLARILHHDWPTPPPLLTWDHGTPKIKQPWPIHKKVAGILRDQHAKSANPWKRWHDITLQEGRKMVEDTLGPMPLGDLSQIPRDKAVRYACRDSDATLRIYPYLEHRLRTLGLLGALDDDMGALPMACDMMETGITADRAHFAVLEKRFADKADNLQADIQQIAGWSMNPGSHDDVRKLLFTDLDLGKGRKIKRTKKGGELSTTDKVISQLLTLHPVVRKIKDYRGYRKLETTYARQMPNWIHPATGRIHTNIRLTRTATGRLSTFDPNLMAIPVRSEESREIRNGFVSAPGCTFLSADYSQIELRCLAHESQDPLMLEVFRTGGDIHDKTASEVFGVPIPNLDKYLHRLPAKRVNFGIPYGIQAPGLQDTLAADGVDITLWTQDRCAEFIEEWFRLYSGVRRWRNGVIAFARRNGYVQDMFGRIRFLAGMHAADKWIILETERQAGNMPIQAGAAGIIKRAMGALVPVYRDFTREGWYIRPLLQIHDDLLWEVEDGFLDTAAIVIRSIMENTTPLSVPTPVDPEIGKRWGEKTAWEYTQ